MTHEPPTDPPEAPAEVELLAIDCPTPVLQRLLRELEALSNDSEHPERYRQALIELLFTFGIETTSFITLTDAEAAEWREGLASEEADRKLERRRVKP